MWYGRLAVAAGWLLAAVLATAVGIAAVGVIGRGLTEPVGESMSGDQIDRALASAGEPSGVPSAAPPSSPAPERSGSRGRKLFTTPAGTVLARCDGQTAELLSWSPANGYHLRELDRRRGTEAEVTFERDGQRVKLKVTCRGGVPQLRLDD
jgi:hypothetical protein